MIKSILDFITGRSHIDAQQLIRFFLDRIEEKDDELDCAFWRIEQLEAELTEKDIALQNERENTNALAIYVDRLVSAITGIEVNVFDGRGSDISATLEGAIADAEEQGKQLLYARTRLSKAESILAELKDIVAQIPSI